MRKKQESNSTENKKFYLNLKDLTNRAKTPEPVYERPVSYSIKQTPPLAPEKLIKKQSIPERLPVKTPEKTMHQRAVSVISYQD